MAIHVFWGPGLLHFVRNDDWFMESEARQSIFVVRRCGLPRFARNDETLLATLHSQ